MALLIGILTFFLVAVCLILILLVLIQLPKKEAGAGVAFGGAATDALFGAGSGNVLTKTTKYMGIAFFGLAVILSLLQSSFYHRGDRAFREELKEQMNQPAMPEPQPAGNATATAPSPTTPVVPPATTTPAVEAPSSNAAPAK